jgi:general secretion pathway protein K
MVGPRNSGGFALIIVLWTLVIIAFIVAHLTASGRTEIRIAGNLVANAVAQAAADGAISAAIFNLSDPRPERRWPVDGNTRQLVIGESQVSVRLEDEAWWINPNTASLDIIEALLRAIGSDPQSARGLAIAIGEWVGSAPAPRPVNVTLADYRAAGLDYGPPGAPLETFDELGRVLGMTPAILATIRPHLTLYGPPQPSAASADPIVVAALVATSQAIAAPSPNQPPPDVSTVRTLRPRWVRATPASPNPRSSVLARCCQAATKSSPGATASDARESAAKSAHADRVGSVHGQRAALREQNGSERRGRTGFSLLAGKSREFH